MGGWLDVGRMFDCEGSYGDEVISADHLSRAERLRHEGPWGRQDSARRPPRTRPL